LRERRTALKASGLSFTENREQLPVHLEVEVDGFFRGLPTAILLLFRAAQRRQLSQ